MGRRTLVKLLAASRIAFGAALVAAPGRVGAASWIGPPAALRGTQVFARALGIRDLALGAGTLLALGRGERAADWVAGVLVSDVTDFAATWAAGDAIPAQARRGVFAAASAAAVISAAWLAKPEADRGERRGDGRDPLPAAGGDGPPAAAAPPPSAEPAA